MSDIATDVIKSLVREAMRADLGHEGLQEAAGDRPVAGIISALEPASGGSAEILVALQKMLTGEATKLDRTIGIRAASQLAVAKFVISREDFSAVARSLKDADYLVKVKDRTEERNIADLVADGIVDKSIIDKIGEIDLKSQLQGIIRFSEIAELKEGGIEFLSGQDLWEKCLTRSSSGGEVTHRVASGDTLAKLASKYLGDKSRWKEIYGSNKEKLERALSSISGGYDDASLPQGVVLSIAPGTGANPIPSAVERLADLLSSKLSAIMVILDAMTNLETRILILKAIQDEENRIAADIAKDPTSVSDGVRKERINRAIHSADMQARGMHEGIAAARSHIARLYSNLGNAKFALEAASEFSDAQAATDALLDAEHRGAIAYLNDMLRYGSREENIEKGPMFHPLLRVFNSIMGGQGLSVRRAETGKGITRSLVDDNGITKMGLSDIANMTLPEIAEVQRLNMASLADMITTRSSQAGSSIRASEAEVMGFDRRRGEKTGPGATLGSRAMARADQARADMARQAEMGIGSKLSSETKRAVDSPAQKIRSQIVGGGSSYMTLIGSTIQGSSNVTIPTSATKDAWVTAAYNAFIRPIARALMGFTGTHALAALSEGITPVTVAAAAQRRPTAQSLVGRALSTTATVAPAKFVGSGMTFMAERDTGGVPVLDRIISNLTPKGLPDVQEMFGLAKGAGSAEGEQEKKKAKTGSDVDFSLIGEVAEALAEAREQSPRALEAALLTRVQDLSRVLAELKRRGGMAEPVKASIRAAIRDAFGGLGSGPASLITDLTSGDGKPRRSPYEYIEGTALEPIRKEDVDAAARLSSSPSVIMGSESAGEESLPSPAVGAAEMSAGIVRKGPDVVGAVPLTPEEEAERREKIDIAKSETLMAQAEREARLAREAERRSGRGVSYPSRLIVDPEADPFGDLDEARTLDALRRALLRRAGRVDLLSEEANAGKTPSFLNLLATRAEQYEAPSKLIVGLEDNDPAVFDKITELIKYLAEVVAALKRGLDAQLAKSAGRVVPPTAERAFSIMRALAGGERIDDKSQVPNGLVGALSQLTSSRKISSKNLIYTLTNASGELLRMGRESLEEMSAKPEAYVPIGRKSPPDVRERDIAALRKFKDVLSFDRIKRFYESSAARLQADLPVFSSAATATAATSSAVAAPVQQRPSAPPAPDEGWQRYMDGSPKDAAARGAVLGAWRDRQAAIFANPEPEDFSFQNFVQWWKTMKRDGKFRDNNRGGYREAIRILRYEADATRAGMNAGAARPVAAK